MPVIIFLFMNSIVLASSFLVTYKLLRLSNLCDSLICWFIIYFSQVVLSELLLGIFGILYLWNVVLLNLVMLMFIWAVTRNKKSSFNFIETRKSPSEALANKTALFITSIILGFGLVKVFINLINPPFGWDDLNYHFTFPVEWIKHGNLANPITIADDPSPSYYPINGSLLFLWLMLPFKSVFLADLGQVPFFFLAFLAVYSLGMKLNLKTENAYLAACLFTLIPNYFKQMRLAYVDVMVAALFLVCLSYLWLLNRELSYKNTLVYSMSLGLLLGTKTIALPYSILLFVPFVFLCIRNARQPQQQPQPQPQPQPHFVLKSANLFLILIAIAVIIALGGFTYIRNFIDTGNPLYPLDLKLFGKDIFRGVMDARTYGAHFKIEDYRLGKILFHEGLGAQSLIFILPSVFLTLPLVLIKKREVLNFHLIYFFILPFLVYLVYRFVIPLANTRYLYPLFGIGMITGFYAVQILNIPERIIGILVFICGLASLSELAKRQELISAIILTAALFIVLRPGINYLKKSGLLKKLPFIFVCAGFIICFLILLEKYYIKNEYPGYVKMAKYSGFWPDAVEAWNWLNQDTKGNNIAYVGRPVPFPLYGTNFKNNVYYVSVNKTEPAKLHYFSDSHYHWGYDFLDLHHNLEEKGNYRSGADYGVWYDNLLKRNTDYLFIYSLHQTKELVFPLEDIWARANPDKFTPAFINETIRIYRILK